MDKHALYTHQQPSRATTAAIPITAGTLQRLTRENLSSRLLAMPLSPDGPLAVIDVRDSDYIGGHIRGGQNVPAPSLDYRMPELVRTLRDKEVVVFHCALSQQRGPGAALRYLRERKRLGLGGQQVGEQSVLEGKEAEQKERQEQKVYILEGGFVKWQEKYGEDERLTEGYQKDIWEFGY